MRTGGPWVLQANSSDTKPVGELVSKEMDNILENDTQGSPLASTQARILCVCVSLYVYISLSLSHTHTRTHTTNCILKMY